MKSFKETVKKIESLQKFGIKLGLDNIKKLLTLLGNPDKNMQFVHIAGTNGKGSVAAMIASILNEAGIITGLYTSPHLVSIRERIRVNGICISEKDFSAIAEEILSIVNSQSSLQKTGGSSTIVNSFSPTFFEVITAIAIVYFAQRKVAWAVIETGMGGRLDATNAVDSALQIITNIEQEHTLYLGESIEDIAWEKAGILKPKKKLITAAAGKALEVIAGHAREMKNTVTIYPRDFTVKVIKRSPSGQVLDIEGPGFQLRNIFCPLLGMHQAVNVALAVCAVKALREFGIVHANNEIASGVEHVSWLGRCHVFSWKERRFILDGAHTPRAAEVLVKTLKDYLKIDCINLIFGILEDKDLDGIVSILAPVTDKIMMIQINNKRAYDVQKMAAAWSTRIAPDKMKLFRSFKDLFDTGFRFFQSKKKPVGVIGSFYLIGEFLEKIGFETCNE